MPGDITGDGVSDVLVGAPGAREGSGRVYLFSGADILEERALGAHSAWAVFEGSAGIAFGSTLTVLGDVDGDGWTDWALGGPQFPGGDAPAGRLWLMPGSATVADGPLGELTGVALAQIDGPNAAALLGRGVAGVGDIDGDGRADIAVVTRDAAASTGLGQLRLIHGRSASNWSTSTDFADHTGGGYTLDGLGDPALGFTLDGLVVGAGDLNGDGLGDLWVGQPGHTGDATRSGMLLLLPGRTDGVVDPASESVLAAFTPDPTLFGSVDLVDAHFGQPLSLLESDSGQVLWVGADGPDRGTALGLSIGPAPFVSEDGVVGAIAAPPAVIGGLAVARGDLAGVGEPALVVGVPRDGEEPGVEGAGRLAILETTSPMIEVTAAFAAFLGTQGEGLGAQVEIVNLDLDAYDDALVSAPGAYGTGAVLVLLGSELADGDGFAPSEGDCDDARASVHPEATEISACEDNLDNDCNGLVDGADAPCILEESGVVVACSAGGSGGPALLSVLLVGLLLGRRRRWYPVAVAAMAVAAVGCAPEGPAAELPSIIILSPLDGDRLESMSVLPIVIEVSAARLAPELHGETPDQVDGAPPVLWSLYVDDLFRGTGGGPVLIAEGLNPGTHTVRAELVDTLGEALEPPASVQIAVQLIAGEPTVVLTEPTDGEVLSPAGFSVEYDVSGLLLNSASIGQANQLGVGHALVTLDGSLVATDADGQAFVANPGTGAHELAVTLVNNDGGDLDPVVSDSVSITVAEPSVTILSPTDSANGGDVQILYEVANFTLDPVNVNGTPEDGSGHVHVYMDNLYQGLDATGSFTVPGVDGCTHLARLELALGGHAELGIADETTFSVSPCVALEGLTENQSVNAAAGIVNITYSSPGHVVEASSPPAIGGNYVTHYLDGAYVGFSFLSGNAPFTGVATGAHDFELRLAEGPVSLGQEQGGELVPRASTSITLDVQ
jgi:MYXO-CTERM domain-containing protein